MSSQTLLRNMLDAALEGGLSLNEWRVFAAVLRQTVGYGKRTDPLTKGRIAKLTGIRKDRIDSAIDGIVEKSLFEQSEHKWLDNNYTVPAGFFEGDATARFFAPSFPVNGESTRPTGNIHHSTGTYRDTPFTEINPTTDNQPAAAVCDVAVESVTEIKKPHALDDATYLAILPALRKLPNSQAVDVLALTAAAILNHSIKTTPARFAGGLIKQAQAGMLDTSDLPKPQAASPAPTINPAVEANNRATELAYLSDMAKRAGIPLSALTGGAA